MSANTNSKIRRPAPAALVAPALALAACGSNSMGAPSDGDGNV